MQSTIPQNVYTKKLDESILVVKRTALFENEAPQGLVNVNLEKYYLLIHEKKEFLWRSQMEIDQQYKQIIPLFVFLYEDRIFLMQRSKKPGDARLAEKYTVGIGGHVRQEDLAETSIQEWGQREFHEEIEYQGALNIKTLGMINDDSNDVGRVHLGFVFLAYGDSDKISIKSELQSGNLVSLEEAIDKGDQLESWTKIIIQTLLQQK